MDQMAYAYWKNRLAAVEHSANKNEAPRFVRQATEALFADMLQKTGSLPWEPTSGFSSLAASMIKGLKQYEERCSSDKNFEPFLENVMMASTEEAACVRREQAAREAALAKGVRAQSNAPKRTFG